MKYLHGVVDLVVTVNVLTSAKVIVVGTVMNQLPMTNHKHNVPEFFFKHIVLFHLILTYCEYL